MGVAGGARGRHGERVLGTTDPDFSPHSNHHGHRSGSEPDGLSLQNAAIQPDNAANEISLWPRCDKPRRRAGSGVDAAMNMANLYRSPFSPSLLLSLPAPPPLPRVPRLPSSQKSLLTL